MIEVVFEHVSGDLRKSLKSDRLRLQKAISASANMVASMQRSQFKADIAQSGERLGNLAAGLTVSIAESDMLAVISTTHERSYAHVFEDGATITGDMWIPLSGTDAAGVHPKEYPGGLFSIKRTATGRPLLFSITDKKPKYFGVESVTIPKKWNLHGIQESIMANFRSIFDDAWKTAAGA